ncbi:hypothetical protein KL86DYS1_10538 [uncultured Dysgonomonas sp.]|uniref:Uncharacterized protein n=1 Tax=uncultured Dysgonomonas sp. TaxID=206096 RepID=A0A212IY95_9BACT|nr:hypothetical protein KL86DYS1_10538 [uncultured Dysgonomonas sp.]
MLPRLASLFKLDLRADTTAISDIEKIPFNSINATIIAISIYILY